LGEFGLKEENYTPKYTLHGFISAPHHGRSAPDRQFYFINSRPCDPTKVKKPQKSYFKLTSFKTFLK